MKASITLGCMGFVPMILSVITGVTEANLIGSAGALAVCGMVSYALTMIEKSPEEAATSTGANRKMFDIRITRFGVDIKEV